MAFHTMAMASGTEEVIKASNARFLKQIKADNSGYSQQISELFEYTLNARNSGARVLDRFGIFLNDCRNNNILLKKTFFHSDRRQFTVVLVLQDRSNLEEYILFTQYSHNSAQKTCKLIDIYFSLVFDAKMKSMRTLFSNEANFTAPNNNTGKDTNTNKNTDVKPNTDKETKTDKNTNTNRNDKELDKREIINSYRE